MLLYVIKQNIREIRVSLMFIFKIIIFWFFLYIYRLIIYSLYTILINNEIVIKCNLQSIFVFKFTYIFTYII